MDWLRAYEMIWRRGRAALRSGELRFERPPGKDSDGRWGVSAMLWPDSATAERLETLSNTLAAVVGPNCWAHDAQSLHFTVRALERYRAPIAEHDFWIELYRDAVTEAAALAEPVRLSLVGLTLAPNGVLVSGVPADDAAERLRESLGNALSARGVVDLEAERRRDTWHATLLHFTGAPADPDALLRWVAARRQLTLGNAVMDRMALGHGDDDGRRVRLRALATVSLGSGSGAGVRTARSGAARDVHHHGDTDETEPGTADLGDRGEDEQRDGTSEHVDSKVESMTESTRGK